MHFGKASQLSSSVVATGTYHSLFITPDVSKTAQ